MKTNKTQLVLTLIAALIIQNMSAIAEEKPQPNKSLVTTGLSALGGAVSSEFFVAPVFGVVQIGKIRSNEEVGFTTLASIAINAACGAVGGIAASVSNDNAFKAVVRKHPAILIMTTNLASAAGILSLAFPHPNRQALAVLTANCGLSATGGYIAGTAIQDKRSIKVIDKASVDIDAGHSLAVNRSPAFEVKDAH